MKKIIIISSIVLFLSVALHSCKSHEKCPAYGKANIEKVNEYKS